MAEEHASSNQQPDPARGQNSQPKGRKGGWGGRRPGAGAPKGNLNALKHGRYTRYQRAVIEASSRCPRPAKL